MSSTSTRLPCSLGDPLGHRQPEEARAHHDEIGRAQLLGPDGRGHGFSSRAVGQGAGTRQVGHCPSSSP